jgi:hypothetical protein
VNWRDSDGVYMRERMAGISFGSGSQRGGHGGSDGLYAKKGWGQ